MEPNSHKPTVDVHISKKALITIAIILAVILLGLGSWRFGVYDWLLNNALPSSIAITVTDASTHSPIVQAKVTLENMTQPTDTDGRAVLTGLKAGIVTVSISATDYRQKSQIITLKHGKNGEQTITLSPLIETFNFTGKVKDYISETPLGGVTVTSSLGSATTNTEGLFHLDKIKADSLELTLEKSGFEKSTKKITLENGKVPELTLVPSGTAVFVSNRDSGKRGIYAAKYDGSGIKSLISRNDITEDFSPAVSPNSKTVTFLSTREKRRLSSSTNYEPSLYLIGIDGTNLIQLSKDFGISNLQWSPNSRYIAWTSHPNEKDTSSTLSYYDTQTKKFTKLSDAGNTYIFQFNHKSSAITWVQNPITQTTDPTTGLFYQELASSSKKQIDSNAVNEVYFSPDDTSLFFDYYDSPNNKTKYVRYNISDQSKADFTPEIDEAIVKVASPDGKMMAYITNRDGKNDVFMSKSDGTNEKQITKLGTATGNPIWDQSGNYILFSSHKTDESALYIVGTTGTTAKKISDIYSENLSAGY